MTCTTRNFQRRQETGLWYYFYMTGLSIQCEWSLHAVRNKTFLRNTVLYRHHWGSYLSLYNEFLSFKKKYFKSTNIMFSSLKQWTICTKRWKSLTFIILYFESKFQAFNITQQHFYLMVKYMYYHVRLEKYRFYFCRVQNSIFTQK